MNYTDDRQNIKQSLPDVQQPDPSNQWAKLLALVQQSHLLIRLAILLLVVTGTYCLFIIQKPPATLAQTLGIQGTQTYSEEECIQCHVAGQGELTTQGELSAQDGLTTLDIPIISTHSNKNFSGTQEPFEFSCTECHEFVHGGGPNIKLIGEYVVVSPSTEIKTGPVTFTARTGMNSFDDGESLPESSRICVTCHINANRPGIETTMVHTGGIHTGGTDFTKQECTTCHPHNPDGVSSTLDGFMPVGGCTVCHADPQDNGDGLPLGGRRAITAEFGYFSHHVQGRSVEDSDCTACHELSTHTNGYLQLKNADTGEIYDEETLPVPQAGAYRVPTTTQALDDLSNFCQSCHDGNGANGNMDPFGDGNSPPTVIVHTNGSGAAEDPFSVGCTQCHASHGGDNNLYIVKAEILISHTGNITTGPVVFTAITDTDSYDEADTASGVPESQAQSSDDICATCHNNPDNTGYPMTGHFGGDDHSGTDYRDQNCIPCHSHAGGFMHGGGGGTGCVECHGHDAGTFYDPDASAPYTAGTISSTGKGSYKSHSTHTETDADDAKGPGIYCDTCHNINQFPYFRSQASSTATLTLAQTDICDDCHSPGGDYDGINDADIGAKNNWDTGVYTTGDVLLSGKEKWCAGCHDDSPSVVVSATVTVTAPNVIGDEEGDYIYGTGWGYYKTGHGLPVEEPYPYKGGFITPNLVGGAVRPMECDSCHDFSTSHIDGLARTFDDGGSSTTDPSVYRQGYRLNLVGGQEPMQIPWPRGVSNSATRYRLCASCHDTGPFTDPDNWNTNLVTSITNNPISNTNRHEYHLADNNLRYTADWDASWDGAGATSRMTCVVCHNVHGSTRLAMVRDGKLVDREPGLWIWYYNEDATYNNSTNTNPPDPQNVPLAASDGTVWRGATSSYLCKHCHYNDNTVIKTRTPYQNVAQAPTLTWTRETGYVYDGVDPESARAGSNFEFRVKYTDKNNDTPATIQVWVDVNDNGSYESGEKYALTEVDPSDFNYTDGKLYAVILPLVKAGDNILNYLFYAADATPLTAQTPEKTVTITNNPPTLSWTAEPYFESDGVHPDTGANGTTFEFRITYTDPDGEAPSPIEVWIDANENDVYDAGEKHTMTAVGGVYTTGMTYAYSATLNHIVDGVISYTFRAGDGIENAVEDAGPLADNLVVVTTSSNNVPTLDWVEASCLTNGVKPVKGLATGDFEFKVKYTDLDNQCPPTSSDIQVVVGGTPYNLTGGAGSCTTGRVYSTTVQLNTAGVFTYYFTATDGTDTATGDPTAVTGNKVTVVSTANALGVRVGSGDSDPWYNTIQAAINKNVANTTILVYEGTYTEDVRLDDTPDTDEGTILESVCGPELTTINASSGNTIFIQNINTSVTVDGFTITGGSDGIVLNTADAIIKNNIIENNNSRGINSFDTDDHLTVENTIIRNNSGDVSGAGIYINGGAGQHSIINSTIISNTANYSATVLGSGSGGGILIQSGADVTISATTISGNSASLSSGGIYVNNSDITIDKTIITSNTSGTTGGGLFLQGTGSSMLTNCNITGNTANTQGGGFYLNNRAVSMVNCTVSGNNLTDTANGQGGGMYANNPTISIVNSIFWGNQAAGLGSGYEVHTNNGSPVTFTYSDVPNNANALSTSGVGSYSIDATNIYTDPLFVGSGDYHLKSVSPAIDRGTTTGAPPDDIDGETRPFGAGVDMGSDETDSSNVPALAWTGETNYTGDGVHPNSALGGSNFEFRVDYTDANNTPPALIQVWIDQDDSSTYEPGEKYTLTAVDAGDTDYTDGKRYATTLPLAYVNDGSLIYRFYASDGANDAVGSPTSDSVVIILNNPPTLDWTGETNYTVDGVDPDSGVNGTIFTFRIVYTDINDHAPTSIQVWVDENDNGSYEGGEKYALTAATGGDGDYTNGEIYTKTLALYNAGDGILNYHFFAFDGLDNATGAPTSNKTITITTNNAPTLNWTGEANYTTDGVDPDSGPNGGSFVFRVTYTDTDNTAPSVIEVWVDENDNSAYESGEKYALVLAGGGDGDYSNGEIFTRTLALNHPGAPSDGVLNYRFYGYDGVAAATGAPTSDKTVTISSLNNAPLLEWVTGDNCRAEGVRPSVGPVNTGFNFRVKYSDPDGDCPDGDGVKVVVNGTPYTLDAESGGSCSAGKFYSTVITPSVSGDLDYSYNAKDSGGLSATGEPTSNHVVSVLNSSTTVRPSGSSLPYDYTSIIGAANAAGGYILVYPNDDFTAATYAETIALYNKDNRTIISACGADFTIMASSGTGTILTVQDSSNFVVDGFSITGATAGSGVNINRVDTTVATFKNSKIYGNQTGMYINDSDNVPIMIDNVEIYNNSSRGIYLVNWDDDADIVNSQIYSHTVSGNGAAIAMNNGNTVTISNTVIRNNTTSSSGGAIYLNAAGANLTIENSSIYDNQAGTGGAIYMATGAYANIIKSVIRDNTATGQGGAIYTNAANFDITNSILTGNQAGTNGGAVSTNSGPTVQIINTTIANNQATNGGVFYICMVGSTTIRNSIFWNNTATGGNGANIYKACGSGNIGTISYSDMTTSSPSIFNASFTDGGGNISPAQDPVFVNPGANNYHIQSSSPCNGAIPPASYTGPSDDIDGDSRPQGTNYDMGADEVTGAGAALVVIVDNLAAALTGDWLSGSGSGELAAASYPGYYDTDFLYHASGNGSNTVTWTPNILRAGNYNVYAWWVAGADRATNAPYTIYYDGGSDQVRVNQQVNGGQWNLLGTYSFATGTSGYIQLSDDADGYVIADAIKVEPQTSPPDNPGGKPSTIYLPLILKEIGQQPEP